MPNLTPETYPSFEPKSVSHSQIDGYNRCPYHYYLKKVLKLEEPPNFYAVFGGMMHEIFERDALEEKKNKRRYTLAALERQYEKAFNKTEFPWPDKRTEDKYYGLGYDMIEFYANDRQRKVVDVEYSFNLEGKVDVPITGFIDLIYETKDGEMVVSDYKTGNPYRKSDLETNKQLTLYCLAFKEKYGKLPDKLEFHFVKTGDRVYVERTEQDIEEMLAYYKESIEKIRAGDFDRTCDNSWWCDNICGFGIYEKCPRK